MNCTCDWAQRVVPVCVRSRHDVVVVSARLVVFVARHSICWHLCLHGSFQTAATLPRIPLATLKTSRVIGAGSFGEVCLSWWEGGHVDVAVKANGVSCLNAAAIDNERQLLELLLQHPHKNILVVYGIVMDAPDGNVRLVMAHCPGGGLDGYLNTVRESREVCARSFFC